MGTSNIQFNQIIFIISFFKHLYLTKTLQQVRYTLSTQYEFPEGEIQVLATARGRFAADRRLRWTRSPVLDMGTAQ